MSNFLIYLVVYKAMITDVWIIGSTLCEKYQAYS